MKFIITGKNLNVTNALKERAEKKIGKLDKFFKEDTDAFIKMSCQKDMKIIEVTIPYNGVVFRAEAVSDDMYASIDKVIDILERQIRKNKTRLEKRLFVDAFNADNFTVEEDVPEEKEFNVIRTKRFAIKPMDVEEAILQMNLLGHQFFVFSNAITNQVNVVYKRKDGNYGLIEPEY